MRLVLPLASTVVLALFADPRLRGPEATHGSFAVFAGLALSVSAVPVIVKIFADLRVLHRDLSQLSLSVAVIDDATVWVGLSIIAGRRPPRGRSPTTSGLGRRSGPHSDRRSSSCVVMSSSLVARRHQSSGAGPTVRSSLHDGDPGVGASCLVAAAFIASAP